MCHTLVLPSDIYLFINNFNLPYLECTATTAVLCLLIGYMSIKLHIFILSLLVETSLEKTMINCRSF